VNVLQSALALTMSECAAIVCDGVNSMYDKPKSVMGCKAGSDFRMPSKHNAVRFFLYRYAARRLGYQARLPLPWGVELIIKCFFPGSNPDDWTQFRAKYDDKIASATASLSSLESGEAPSVDVDSSTLLAGQQQGPASKRPRVL
jgi:hypothetical protein